MPVLVLPNLYLGEAIGDGDIAVTRTDDGRVQEATAEQPRLGDFLSRFTDAFGEPVDPSVLIVRQDSSESYRDTSAIAGFRDLLAVATLPTARALQITDGGGLGNPVWAETFSFYPWMVDREGEQLIGQTPAMLGSHLVDDFRGQTDAGLPQFAIATYVVDRPIFDEVLRRWHRRFGDGEASWEDRALFRSLNMAHHAMMMPGGLEYGFYDVGRLLTLWVSAFEILLHPGPGGIVGEAQVVDVLDRARWVDNACATLCHQVTIGRRSAARTLASSLYDRIYRLRNDFLHGNEVTAEQLATNEVPLLLLASSLYRIALVTFLELEIPPIAENADQAAMVAYIGTLTHWRDPQRRHERAILKAMALPETDD
ncbi:hypothetical protein GCM10010862_08650 [Devosia nitrariae]|uniref:Apea-like HEPN domain-containing protein n=1 Tax=Devosia nitrariae TaxID=2071872 RepID=A0ABQ5W1C7_9HYPH|nr:hypothetical protein GCM10010862_08650 [Devosia nitrariae]